MDALLLISVVCFFILFVVALAIARHIRVESARLRESPELVSRSPSTMPEHDKIYPLVFRPVEQQVRHVVRQKEPDWRFLVSDDRRRSEQVDDAVPLTRKPPGQARHGQFDRPDWAYFNKDLGDLRDPYEPPAAIASWTSGSTGRRPA